MENNKNQDPKKVWISLFFDIIIPVLILNKLSPFFEKDGAFYALLIALFFPLSHGLFDFLKAKKINWLSLLGLFNVLFTGGLALMKLEGFWFAVKEAGFPSLIGIFVFFSCFSKKPLFSFFLNQPGLFNKEQIDQKLEELDNKESYKALIKRCTFFLSGTFFFSAFLNFFLAIRIFKELPGKLSETERAEILNSQIADMTWMGYLVIALPLMLITALIFFYCLKNLSKLTHLSLSEMMNIQEIQSKRDQ